MFFFTILRPVLSNIAFSVGVLFLDKIRAVLLVVLEIIF